ncbi:pyridoxamine 5'-phosphate oxidase family protein [Amycolatopsis anabasis]|uniref:pyridoxamine 5'-phosphate oxidase family protein n=1 Tax=Amycolatopsis anabasis TaxID=1840409 RepID=UPI00131AFF79|nr:pyridoxamine 5'-phosphate oxidase family protein [Amycolatopsis anabasis]
MSDDQRLPWERVSEQLARARNYWVGTVGPRATPHSRPMWGLWWRDGFVFNTGPDAGTARNLAARPEVTVHLESAEHVVIVEGVADRIAEPAALPEAGELVGAWTAKYPETPADAITFDRAFFLVRPRAVLAWTLAGFPGDLTRWRFG